MAETAMPRMHANYCGDRHLRTMFLKFALANVSDAGKLIVATDDICIISGSCTGKGVLRDTMSCQAAAADRHLPTPESVGVWPRWALRSAHAHWKS